MRKIFSIVMCLSVALFPAALLSSCGGDGEDDVEKATAGGGKSEAGDDESKGGDGSGDKQYTHAVVDLGLPSGLLWATCNVGASTPYEDGDYFAWGETEPKSDYSWNTYKWCNGSCLTLTKYCDKSTYGFTDDKTVLDAEDDAATANWGAGYRMPTSDEFTELNDNCTWTWDSLHNGYTVTGTNGNSIFLPASGCRDGSSLDCHGSNGYYWHATLPSGSPALGVYLYFSSGDHYSAFGSHGRNDGHPVRPVAEP